MKEYEVKEIVGDVRIAIDENVDSSAMENFGDVDTLELKAIIERKIADAARLIEMDAPLRLLGGGTFYKPETVSIDGAQYTARVDLPEDFMRLIVFNMTGWSTPAFRAISVDDAKYAIIRSRYTSVKPNDENPVVAIVPSNDEKSKSGMMIEAFGNVKADAKVAYMRYMKRPMVTEDGKIELSEDLYEAIVYETAALTMQAIKDTEMAGNLHSIAQRMAQIAQPQMQKE